MRILLIPFAILIEVLLIITCLIISLFNGKASIATFNFVNSRSPSYDWYFGKQGDQL